MPSPSSTINKTLENPSNNNSQGNTNAGANIVLIGAPGSGKGTQSAQLTERYQICQISTGDLLRVASRDKNSPEGEKIRRAMETGGLVDDNTVMSLIEKNLTKPECQYGVLFDGFPRTIYQGEQLEKLLASKQKRLDAVLEYAIDDNLLKSRILGRLVHRPSGRTYHEEFHPPKQSMKDDITGEPLERRSDDTNETLTARLNTYHKQTKPLVNESLSDIDFYRQRNLHRSIDATQKVNEVSKQSIAIIEQLRQQNSSRLSDKIQSEDILPVKSKISNTDVNPSRLSHNFLFIYNSVTSVLRDRGII